VGFHRSAWSDDSRTDHTAGRSRDWMKVLFLSSLFPDATNAYWGLDNSVLVRELSRYCDMRVISPRLSLPFRNVNYAPRHVDRQFEPLYPNALHIPKVGSYLNHLLLARAIRRPLQTLHETFGFDVILCAWLYPDGCAVARVAQELGTPFILVAQGSDVHAYLRITARRRLILRAVRESSATITRSRRLAALLKDAGVATDRLHPVYNGVDLETFRPGQRDDARRKLGLPRSDKIILFVGEFKAVKNPLLLVQAHGELSHHNANPTVHLVMIGDGPLREAAQLMANKNGAEHAVHFVGLKPPQEVAQYMQAADVLCVPSDNEGVPNVVLEAFACGLAVVSTRVGGIPEVLTESFLGRLVAKRNAPELVSALQETLRTTTEPERIRTHALRFSWERCATEYLQLLERARLHDTRPK